MLIAFVIWTMVAFVFLLIGVNCRKSEKTVGFFSNVKPPEIKDVKGYNKAVAKIWFGFATAMEILGIRLDAEGLHAYIESLKALMHETEERIYMLAGREFNLNSPKQLGEVLFEEMGLPALKKTMGKGADVSKRNIGYVLVDSLPGVTTFLKNEVNQLDLRAQIYVAGILSGKKSLRLEKEHWPETYWGWMMKVDGL